MDETTFKDRVKKLNEINKVVEKLDPAIRGQAFALLEDYVGAGKITPRRPEGGKEKDHEQTEPAADPDDLEEALEGFVAKLEAGTPADNAQALAAFHYSRYGKAAFTTAEIQRLANQGGLTIPDRSDKTFKVAKVNKKALFRQDGRSFTPTVNGETHFKNTYKVKKGKRPKPAATED